MCDHQFSTHLSKFQRVKMVKNMAKIMFAAVNNCSGALQSDGAILQWQRQCVKSSCCLGPGIFALSVFLIFECSTRHSDTTHVVLTCCLTRLTHLYYMIRTWFVVTFTIPISLKTVYYIWLSVQILYTCLTWSFIFLCILTFS